MKNVLIFLLSVVLILTTVRGLLHKLHCTQEPIVKLVPFQKGLTTQIWRVTAYCVCEQCCGRWSDGFTASGHRAEGKLIAAPNEIPFGTWIDVPGYGMAEVKDRGGAIKGRRLDLLFPTHQEALEWGVQYLEIKL